MNAQNAIVLYFVGSFLNVAWYLRPAGKAIETGFARRGMDKVWYYTSLFLAALVWPVVLIFSIFMWSHKALNTEFHQRIKKNMERYEKTVRFDDLFDDDDDL